MCTILRLTGFIIGSTLPVFAQVSEWTAYGYDASGIRHAPISDITPANVSRLEVAWTYRTGDVDRGEAFKRKAAFECTPLVVDATMYLTTPSCRAIALDAETGAEKWTFDPKVDLEGGYSEITNRGVSIWTDSTKKKGEAGHRRLYYGTIDARLICLDAATGKPCADFGDGGTINLYDGIPPRGAGQYQVTSPPAIVGDILVTGSSMGDNRRVDVESGVVRAFDIRSGKRLWSWDPIPRDPSAPNAKTWKGDKALTTGAANVWSIISADPELGLIYLPTSSPSPDHFGGERIGDNLYGNCLVALHVKTGKLAWHFQVVHHDLWDYDLPCQPLLTTVRKDGKDIPVVVQSTKIGHVFVLDRKTGEPIFPVEERPVPKSTIADEETSPTQPFPVKPPSLVPPLEVPFRAWGTNEAERKGAEERAAKFRFEGTFTPPSPDGSIEFPSTSGGSNWGGITYDPGRGILVANVNRIAHVIRIVPRHEFNVEQKAETMRGETAIQVGTDYGMERYVFRLPNRMPATPPPWGLLVGVDLNEGTIKWRVPLGYVGPKGSQGDTENWGSPQLGGAVTTGGGLVFVAATMDAQFRAFDTETGEELWEVPLPAGGQATPMSYRATEHGRQFVVICAGGHGKMGTPPGDFVVAYALPKK